MPLLWLLCLGYGLTGEPAQSRSPSCECPPITLGLSQTLRDSVTGNTGALKPPPISPAPTFSAEPLFSPEPNPEAAAASCQDRLTGLLEQAPLRFAPGSARLLPESRSTLDALARVINACPPGVIHIDLHTRTADAHLQQLQQARGRAVRAALIRRGLPARRLQIRLLPTDPLSTDDPRAGAPHPRIEWHVTPP